jgi:nucleotide-binding universal stress UspA family protein
MAAYERILVAIDFSPSSHRALREAVRIAEGQAQLILVHVTPKLHPALPWSGTNRKVVTQLGREAVVGARAALKELAQGLPDVRTRTHVRIGVAHEAILDEARRHKAELIVIGSLGHTLTDRLAMGSTAERVARKAPIPVLVTPAVRR